MLRTNFSLVINSGTFRIIKLLNHLELLTRYYLQTKKFPGD